jgi:hypothetical protein
MTKSTRQSANGKSRKVSKPLQASGAPLIPERKLTPDVITHLNETRERVLHGRVLKTDSTETLRRFRDGGIEELTYRGKPKPPAKRWRLHLTLLSSTLRSP